MSSGEETTTVEQQQPVSASRCPECKGPLVKSDKYNWCPVCKKAFCGQETEVFSRVVGYHRPIKNWNKGKQAEFKDRKTYQPVTREQLPPEKRLPAAVPAAD